MNFVQFINNRTEELMDEQAIVKSYSLARDCEGEGLRQLMKAVRLVAKWIYFFRGILHFALLSVGLAREPRAILYEKKVEENKSKLRKIGMNERKKENP